MRKVADAYVIEFVDGAGLGLKFSHKHAQEGGFAGAVRADQSDAILGTDDGIDLIEEDFFAKIVRDLVDRNHFGRLLGMCLAECLREGKAGTENDSFPNGKGKGLNIKCLTGQKIVKQ